MRKESIEQKEIAIPNMYVPYKRAPKHTHTKNDRTRWIKKPTIIVIKDRENLYNTINHLDLIYIYIRQLKDYKIIFQCTWTIHHVRTCGDLVFESRSVKSTGLKSYVLRPKWN